MMENHEKARAEDRKLVEKLMKELETQKEEQK